MARVLAGVCFIGVTAGRMLAQPCTGDCSGDFIVSVDELVAGIGIALASRSADTCPAFDGNGDASVSIEEVVAAVDGFLNGCRLSFETPTDGMLVHAAGVTVTLRIPLDAAVDTLSVELDGSDVTDAFGTAQAGVVGGMVRQGTLTDVIPGSHLLSASVEVEGFEQERVVRFDAIALDRSDECEVLNDAECALPYPSSRFLAPAATATGFRLDFPPAAMPSVNGPPISTVPYNEIDGFSPTAQILMHFPPGVDPERSGASRLLPAGCCGQPVGPPWIDTRTYDDRSLDADSPSVLLDAGTGERVLHFLENDAKAEGQPARQVLFLRPAASLIPGHRYVVAMRNLKDRIGNAVEAEPAFAALRDQRPTQIAAIEERRADMESLFTLLEEYGIERNSLVLAFDFVVQSERQLTHQILSMRDQGFEDLRLVEENPNSLNFNVSSVQEHDCGAPGAVVWREVTGMFRVPLFLTGDPDEPGAPVLNVDPNDTPLWRSHTFEPFFVSIPCSVLDPKVVSRPLLLGHGAFGSGVDMTTTLPGLVGGVTDWTYIAGATDWRGLSRSDLNWLLQNIVGTDGTSKFNNFPALPDRVRQGMLNTLILARMMKVGIFNRHPAFQTSDGEGVFPGVEEELFYYGVSLGGILGTYLAALTPDIERFALEVPTMNFIGCLTQRSTQFGPFVSVLAGIGLDDPMQTALFLNLLHEIWVSAEPAGYARHITTDPLPGSGSAKRVLYRPAWLDKQVPNQCTEITVRTLGLSNLEGSIVAQLQGIPDVPAPQDSAMVMYDSGSFDLFDPLHEPFIPPLGNLVPDAVCDPHGATRRIPAAIEQLVAFLQPGGRIENFCQGQGNLCDADRPSEIADGRANPCDPLGGL